MPRTLSPAVRDELPVVPAERLQRRRWHQSDRVRRELDRRRTTRRIPDDRAVVPETGGDRERPPRDPAQVGAGLQSQHDPFGWAVPVSLLVSVHRPDRGGPPPPPIRLPTSLGRAREAGGRSPPPA